MKKIILLLITAIFFCNPLCAQTSTLPTKTYVLFFISIVCIVFLSLFVHNATKEQIRDVKVAHVGLLIILVSVSTQNSTQTNLDITTPLLLCTFFAITFSILQKSLQLLTLGVTLLYAIIASIPEFATHIDAREMYIAFLCSSSIYNWTTKSLILRLFLLIIHKSLTKYFVYAIINKNQVSFNTLFPMSKVLCIIIACITCITSNAQTVNNQQYIEVVTGRTNTPYTKCDNTQGTYKKVQTEHVWATIHQPGCTDALACNFDPKATEDNNTCCYTREAWLSKTAKESTNAVAIPCYLPYFWETAWFKELLALLIGLLLLSLLVYGLWFLYCRSCLWYRRSGVCSCSGHSCCSPQQVCQPLQPNITITIHNGDVRNAKDVVVKTVPPVAPEAPKASISESAPAPAQTEVEDTKS